MPLGIVLERRDAEDQWIDYTWQAVSVIPGAAPIRDWVEIGRDDGWVQFHAATLELELFRKETEGYKHNLSLEQPSVFIVLREADEDDPHEIVPFLATVCPYEAQDYMDSGEEIVEHVPMPDSVAAWMAEFIETHHVDEPFKKRKLKPFDPRKEGFDRPPPRVSNKWNRASND
jgi:hypothetical protein